MDGTVRHHRWWMLIYLMFGWVSGFGCMSFNLGNKTYESPTNHIDQTGVLRQRGEAPLFHTADDRIEIYYPRPYASKPNLKLGKEAGSVGMNEIELLEQTTDHFTVRWKGSVGEAMLSWQADGVPGPITMDTTPAKVVTAGGQ